MLEHIKKQLNNHHANILGYDQMKKYAVLIPVVAKANQELSILFQVRSQKLRRQPGEISFPGGRLEEFDLTPMDGAIRETIEELGIIKETIDVLGSLGVYIPSVQTVIYPYVASIDTTNFSPNPDEVEELFEVPLSFFLNNQPEKYAVKIKMEPDEDFPFHLIPGGRNYTWRRGKSTELFYRYQDKIIWGMTARMLYHFINIIR